ncbi:MAG: hypothetical protein P0Y52_10085 [Candidatus Brevundimonas phytovorans]|nr:hypothetical protein [Brevundimonas sp.]WEK56894.1 MAG: hypothetical protein P0Y52_10085 [Brevundimonas sp.]
MARAADMAPMGASNRLRVEVAGVISPRCAMGQSENSSSFGQLLDMSSGGTVARSLKLDFTFNCNSPFRAVLTSQNGGLLTDASPASGFRNRIAYDAALALPNGRSTTACSSARMQARGDERSGCTFRFNDRDGASGAASVKLSMAPDPSPVLAGQYRDRLVVRLSPILGGERD